MSAPLVFARPEPLEPHILAHLAAQCSNGDSDYSPDATEESNNQFSNDTTDVKSNGSSLQDVHRLAGLNPPDDISSSPKALAALTNVRDVVLATPLLAKASLSEAAQRGPAIALRSELLSRSTADDSSSEDSVVTLSGLRVPRGLVDAPPLSLNALHLYHIDILPQVWDDLYGRRPAESSTVYRPSSPKQSNTMPESLSASAAALPGMSRILDSKRTHFKLSGAAQNSAKVARDEKEESRAHGNPATEDVALAWKQLHIPRPAYSEADLKEWCETHPVVRQHVLLDRQAPEWAANLPWLNGTYVSQLHSHVCHGGAVPSESPLLRGKNDTQQSGKQSKFHEDTRAAFDIHDVSGQQTKRHEDTSAAAKGTTTAAHVVSGKQSKSDEENPATGAYASGKRERGQYDEQHSSHPTLNSKTEQPMTGALTNSAKNQNKQLEGESPIQTSMDVSAPSTTYSSHSASSRGRSRVRTARPSQRTSEKLLSGTRGSLVREMTSENGTIVRQELLHIFFIARQSLTANALKKDSSSSNVRSRLHTNVNRSPNSQQRRTRSCIPSRSSNHEQIDLDGSNQMANGSNQTLNGSNQMINGSNQTLNGSKQQEKTPRDKVESSDENPSDTIELISKYFPTLRDASIIAPREKTIVANRVYAAFYNRRITYSYDASIASDKKKVHSRRDAEIVRIKKYLLRKLQDRVALGIPLIPVKTIRPEAMRRRSLTPTSKGPQGLDDQSNRSDSLGTSASREHSSYTSSSADSARSSRGDIHARNADSSSSSSGARKSSQSALSGSDPALEDGHGNSSFNTNDTKGKHYANSTSSDVNQLSGSSSGASSRLHSRYTSSSSSSFSDTHGDKGSNQRQHQNIYQPMSAHTSDISMDNSSSSSSAHSTEESTLKPTISDAIPVSTFADAINTTTTTTSADSNTNDTDMTIGKEMTNSSNKTTTDMSTTTTTSTMTSMTSATDSKMNKATMTSATDSSIQDTTTSTSTAIVVSTGDGTLSGPQQINHDLGQGTSPDGLLVNSFESLDPFLVPIAALPSAVRRNVVKLSESMRESGYHYHDLDYDIEYSEDIVTPLLMDVDSQELVRAETQGTSVHDATAVGREESASIPTEITTDNNKADVEKDESDNLQSPRNIPNVIKDTEDDENEKPARAAEIARALRSAAGFDRMTLNGADSSTTGRSSTAPVDQPRPSRNLPPSSVQRLRDWLFDPRHVEHPYPSENEKKLLETESGLNRKQLNNWFTNARKRIWQPELERQRTGKQTDSFNEVQSTNQIRAGAAPSNDSMDEIPKNEVHKFKQHPSVISAPPNTGVHGPHFSTHEKHKSRSAYTSSDVVTKSRPPLVQNFSYPPDVRNLRPNNTYEAVGMPRSHSQIQSAHSSNIGMVPLSDSHSMHQNLTSWLPIAPPEHTVALHPTENTLTSDQKSKQQSQTTSNTFTQDTNTSTTHNQPSNESNQQSAAIPEHAQYVQRGNNGNTAAGQPENVTISRNRAQSTYSAPPFNMTHVSSMSKQGDVPEEYAEKMALDALNKYFEWAQYLQHKHGSGTQTGPQPIPFANPTQKNDLETHTSSGTKPSFPVGPFHPANGQQYSFPRSNMHGIHPSMLSHPQYQYYNMYDTMNYPQSSMHTQNIPDHIKQRSMINEQKNKNSSTTMNKNSQTIEKESDHFPRYPPPPSHFGVPIQSSGNNGVSVPHVGPAQHAPQLPTHASRETDMPPNQIDNSGKILQDGSLNQPIPSHTIKQYHPYFSTTYPATHGGITMTDTPYHSRQHPYPYFADETNLKNEISNFPNGSNFEQLGPHQRIQYARHLANQILNSSTTSGSYTSIDSSNKNSSQSEETLARQRKASARHAARYGKRNMSTDKDNKTLSTNQPNESSSKRRKTSSQNDPNTRETTNSSRSKNEEQTSQENETRQSRNTNNISSRRKQKRSASTKNPTTKRKNNSTVASDTTRTRKRTRSSRSSQQQQQQDHSSSSQSKGSLSHQKSSTNSTDPKQLTNNTNSTQSNQQNKSSHKLNTGNSSGGDNTAHNTHSTGSESSSHDGRIACENTGSEHTGSEHTSENTTSENHGTSEEGLAATNSREGRSTGSAGTGASRQLLEDQLKNDSATNALLAAANVIEQAAAQESKQRSKTDTQNNHQHGGNRSSDQELSGTGAVGYHTGGSSGFGESYRSFSIGDSRSGSRHTTSTGHR